MSVRSKHFKIGLFVLSGTTIAIASLVVFGGGTFFEKTIMMETYFNESVQGVNVGASVTNRGVQIGTVKEIGFVRDEYRSSLMNEEDNIRYGSYVIVKVAIKESAPTLSAEELKALLKSRVDAGLRIRLVSQGITGLVTLDADFLDAQRFPPLPIAWTPKTPYVPAAPSTITVFGKAFDNIVKDLSDTEIAKVVAHLDTLIVNISTLAERTDLPNLSLQINHSFDELQGALRQARRLLEDPHIMRAIADVAAAAGQARGTMGELSATSTHLKDASEHLPNSLARLDRVLRLVEHLLSSQGQDVEEAIHNFKVVSDDLRELTNSAKKYPAQVLMGEPPPRKERGQK